jgi:hypothetical protein
MVKHGETDRPVKTLVRQRHRRSVLTNHADTLIEPAAKLLRKPAVRLDTGEASYAGMQQISRGAGTRSDFVAKSVRISSFGGVRCA